MLHSFNAGGLYGIHAHSYSMQMRSALTGKLIKQILFQQY